MKKKILILCCLAAICTLNTGCFPSAGNSNPDASNTPSQTSINSDGNANNSQTSLNFTKHIEQELDTNITVNADVIYPEISQASTAVATARYFTDKTDVTGAGSLVYYPNGDIKTSARFTDSNLETSPYDDIISSNFSGSNEKEINGFTRESAAEQFKTFLTGLNIPIYENPEIYAFDKEELNEMFSNNQNGLKPSDTDYEFTAEDEIYAVRYKLTADDMPLVDVGYPLSCYEEGGTEGSFAFAYISKEKILYVKIAGIFDLSEKQNTNIITPEKALDSIKTHYKNIIVTNPLNISKLSLGYIPIPEELINKYILIDEKAVKYDLIPTWIVEIKQTFSETKGEDTIVTEDIGYILINAITGEEIR
jgi:hypothetical protein